MSKPGELVKPTIEKKVYLFSSEVLIEAEKPEIAIAAYRDLVWRHWGVRTADELEREMGVTMTTLDGGPC